MPEVLTPTARRQKNAHFALFLIHAALTAVWISISQLNRVTPIKMSLFDRTAPQNGDQFPIYDILEIETKWYAAAFSVITSLAHLIYFVTEKKEKRVPLHWLFFEYSCSAPLISVATAQLAGVYELSTLVCIAVLVVVTMATGAIQVHLRDATSRYSKLSSSQKQRVRKGRIARDNSGGGPHVPGPLPFLTGALAISASWFPVIVLFLQDAVPWFVFLVVASEFVMYGGFAVVFAFHVWPICGTKRWSEDRVRWAFIIMSAISKILFPAIVAIGSS